MTMTIVPENILAVVPGSVAEDWKQCSNGGGWIYKTAQVTENAYVGANALVFGNALVYGNARVTGNALVSGDASIG